MKDKVKPVEKYTTLVTLVMDKSQVEYLKFIGLGSAEKGAIHVINNCLLDGDYSNTPFKTKKIERRSIEVHLYQSEIDTLLEAGRGFLSAGIRTAIKKTKLLSLRPISNHEGLNEVRYVQRGEHATEMSIMNSLMEARRDTMIRNALVKENYDVMTLSLIYRKQ